MSAEQNASGNGHVRQKSARKLTFFAGALVATVAIVNLGVDVGKFAFEHKDDVFHFVNNTLGKDLLPEGTGNLFPKPMYFAMNYGHGDIQVYRATIRGSDDLEGEITDVTTQSKGVIRGHRRAGALTFEWASEKIDRPGFGTYVMRPFLSREDKDDPVYAGMVTFHHCECGATVRNDGPIETAEVLMTSHPVPLEYLQQIFFKDGAEKAHAIFPTDVQLAQLAKQADINH